MSTELSSVSSSNLIMQSDSFERVMRMADVMASGKATVPDHLRNNSADCAAIVMQSMQWNMNPFSVGQKTFIQGGKLSYEAQLVNAVINSIGPLEGRPEYEFIGDWSKIIGKVKEMTSEKGGKYYVSNWNAIDEIGVGVKCHYKMKGHELRTMTLMLGQCWPRFSTQWATDPQQQICYSIIKKIARREFPEIILGVYTPDEFVPDEIDITPISETQSFGQQTQTAQPQQTPDKPVMSDEKFSANFATYQNGIFKAYKNSNETGEAKKLHVVQTLKTQYALTEEQESRILNIQAPIEGEAEVVQ